jgi:hypothetical protein
VVAFEELCGSRDKSAGRPFQTHLGMKMKSKLVKENVE